MFTVPRWLAAAMLAAATASGAPALEWKQIDDFEDARAWVKGDPNTDLRQKDAAVTTTREFVKHGKQALAFLIRVNWTKRPGEKYAKGWPMMRRRFDKPQDWSSYDYLYFWLYAKTRCDLRQPRVLRIGFPDARGKRNLDWYTIPNIRPNRWQEVVVPLTLDVDWRRVTGISFYVAEAWYHDGDKVDFYIDDMRLARRTTPAFASCEACARIFPRGKAVGVRFKIVGPYADARLRVRIADPNGARQADAVRPLTGKDGFLVVPVPGLPAGGHYAVVELLDRQGRVADTRKCYFRSLQPGKRCYLKLITFYTKPLGRCDPAMLKVLNDSAYAGVAIPLRGSYDTDPPPAFESLLPAADAVRAALRIDPWPWVALNRLIGSSPDGRGHAHRHAKNESYFTRIKGLDLDNETGARADFLAMWRLAVRLAKRWRSPGVMLDPEAYNNYRAYSVAYMAQKRGESVDEVITKCEKLGADMAKVIEQEYPRCIVWSLFSRFERRDAIPGRSDKVYTTPTYIMLGLLKYAKAHRVPLKLLCGGETTPGYVNLTLKALRRRIADRDAAVAPLLERFPRRFFLAGTISPFHDYSITTSWIKKRYAGSTFKSLDDFQPFFRTLFDAYDWVWIYASSAARTQPYSPENNRLYSRVLRAALDESAAGR